MWNMVQLQITFTIYLLIATRVCNYLSFPLNKTDRIFKKFELVLFLVTNK